MDRTLELFELAQSASAAGDGNNVHPTAANPTLHSISKLPSPLISHASDISTKMDGFYKFLLQIYVAYVGYHRHLSLVPRSHNKARQTKDKLVSQGHSKLRSFSAKHVFDEEERAIIDSEIDSFIVSAASVIQNINRTIEDDESMISNCHMEQFYRQILSYLMNKFTAISRFSEIMRKIQKKKSSSPFRLLLSAAYYTDTIDARSYEEDEVPIAPIISSDSKPHSSTSSMMTATVSRTSNSSSGVGPSFADRYIDEIAPSKTLTKYRQISENHKKSLLSEARNLREKFSEELQESSRMEQTVNGITGMMTEFMTLLESQSDTLVDIGDSSKLVVNSVKQAEAELTLTLSRTQHHQWSMIALVIALTLMLLLLDALTP